ncbi:hypothetical protein L9F63_004369, partial [Diploptera punctata]
MPGTAQGELKRWPIMTMTLLDLRARETLSFLILLINVLIDCLLDSTLITAYMGKKIILPETEQF